jgi:head-tail adaptor
MAVSAGDLKKMVTLKTPISGRNVRGEKELTHSVLGEFRAKVEQTNQQRALEVAPVLVDTDKVHVRYSSLTKDINKNWLVGYDDKDHVIQSIEVIGNKQFIKLIVKANG